MLKKYSEPSGTLICNFVSLRFLFNCPVFGSGRVYYVLVSLATSLTFLEKAKGEDGCRRYHK